MAWIEPLDSRAANPYVPLTLGVITLLLAGLGLIAALRFLIEFFRFKRSVLKITQPVNRSLLKPLLIIFFALIAAASTFMTLPSSQPVWELVTILQVAEFPWRMLGLANLGLAFTTAAAVFFVASKDSKIRRSLHYFGPNRGRGAASFPGYTFCPIR